ncbi:MAG TPA: sigma-70 family RNA polymerase sigma factor [Cytophagaceae bacterium]
MKTKDQEVLQSLRQGNDRKALEALYKSVYPKIKKLVNEGKDQEEEAKDIMQEALLVFYKQVMMNRFDERFEVEGYIYSIARNLWINRVKRKKRMVEFEQQELPELIEGNILDEMELEERKILVRKVFGQLENKCKELLTYTIYKELSMTEIAKKMGYNSANAATVASYRCKKYLLDLIKKSKSIYSNLS